MKSYHQMDIESMNAFLIAKPYLERGFIDGKRAWVLKPGAPPDAQEAFEVFKAIDKEMDEYRDKYKVRW